MGARSERISIHFDGYVTLGPDGVWPDRDGPDEVTTAEVVRAMERCGAKWSTLSDWCLADEVEVWVSVDDRDAKQAWR